MTNDEIDEIWNQHIRTRKAMNLHVFGQAIAAVEHEACKQACRVVMASYPLTGHAAADCIKAISRRSKNES